MRCFFTLTSKQVKTLKEQNTLSIFSQVRQKTFVSVYYLITACDCEYNGKTYKFGEVIYETNDGDGYCLEAVCGVNATVSRFITKCPTTTAPSTPFTFTTSKFCVHHLGFSK